MGKDCSEGKGHGVYQNHNQLKGQSGIKKDSQLGFRKGMAIATLNIYRLTTHIDELRLVMEEKNIHILAINETKLDELMPASLVSVDGYSLEREDRNFFGGGVAIYIKNTINYEVIKNIPETTLEILCIKILPKQAEPFVIVSWYRPPLSQVACFEELENVLRFLELSNNGMILLGDTNCDLFKDSNNMGHLIDIYDNFGFRQLIKDTTRETLTTKTLIQHIATTQFNNIVESGVCKINISDHYLVYCVRKFKGRLGKIPKTFESRQLKNFNKEMFIQHLSRVYWDDLVDYDDPNAIVDMWTKMFTSIIDKHAPLRKRKGKNTYSPWVTPDLVRKRRLRDMLKSKAVALNSNILMQASRNIRNETNKLNSSLKREYFSKQIDKAEGDIKATWKTVNKLLNKKSKTTEIPHLDVDGEIITDTSKKAEELNKYFANIGKTLNSNFEKPVNDKKPESYLPKVNSIFKFKYVMGENVVKAISRLKTKRTYGLDKISSFILKIGLL